uniref:Mutator-like transposase domain-containing protein n=1 Tax=Biomphalaria glabrata TaxID=6526 RepID=A0A2C9L576_BIOGL
MLRAKCLHCETLHATDATSKFIVDSKHYEINRRLVASFLNIGLGYAGMESFCEALGIDSMTSKTYSAHLKFIENKNKTFIEDIRAKAVEKVRSFYGATSKEDTIDITVSFDGSWQKRGHTSKHGLGVVIETTTGLAVDFHVMSTCCQKCSTTGKNMLKRGKAVYDEWFKRHELDYTINHSGSSGLMEVNVAKVMWLRSQNLGFRYTTFVSDGDYKTYKELQSLAPYSVPIKKEECINQNGLVLHSEI